MLLALVLAGCNTSRAGVAVPVSVSPNGLATTGTVVPPAPSSAAVAPSASSPPGTAKRAEDCPLPRSGFDCDFQNRFAAVQDYVARRPGTVGVVVRDRQTGGMWRNAHAGDLTWTASTIKLAMAVNLLLRDRGGSIALSTDDRGLITAMLRSSDDKAADTLWYRYAGADHLAFNHAFPTYGMTSLRPQQGFTDFYPYWGFQKCTTDDLDRLMSYVLTKLPAEPRDYILREMRGVAANQQWGVWGAGRTAEPGNKNGWSEEQGGWVVNSVGFVGPGERYTLAIMNNLRGKGGYEAGRTTVTEVARLIFTGRF